MQDGLQEVITNLKSNFFSTVNCQPEELVIGTVHTYLKRQVLNLPAGHRRHWLLSPACAASHTLHQDVTFVVALTE